MIIFKYISRLKRPSSGSAQEYNKYVDSLYRIQISKLHSLCWCVAIRVSNMEEMALGTESL
jgi:hypothetical protein